MHFVFFFWSKRTAKCLISSVILRNVVDFSKLNIMKTFIVIRIVKQTARILYYASLPSCKLFGLLLLLWFRQIKWINNSADADFFVIFKLHWSEFVCLVYDILERIFKTIERTWFIQATNSNMESVLLWKTYLKAVCGFEKIHEGVYDQMDYT